MSPRLFINDFFPSNRDLKSILFIAITKITSSLHFKYYFSKSNISG